MNKIKTDGKIFDVLNMIFLLLLVFVTLFPMFYIFIVSISEGSYVSRGMVTFYPRGFTLDAYKTVFQNSDIWRSYGNTILYTTVGTIINLIMTSLCAYPLSRPHLYGRTFLIFFIALTMFLQGGMIPLYLVVQNLGMIDTMWAVILPTAISTFNVIIMKTFFEAIPNELHESSYIDGANDLQILFRIVIPLSKPVMATMTLFYAVYHWNSFFPALIYLQSKKLYPVQILLRNLVVEGDLDSSVASGALDFNVVAQNYKFAVIIITVLPILFVYPFLQKHFAKGVMIGAIK